MSSFSRIKTSSVNIDRYISSELGLESGLSPQEKELLKQFHTLSEHEDYYFLWTCAQMVADEMTAGNPEIILTPYGVTEKSYLYKSVKMTESEERIIKIRILFANQRFLNLWTLKVQQMREQREKINSLTQETRDLLNKNIFAVEAIRRVVKLLIEQGFTPTNPNVVNTPVSQALSKGVHIHSENQFGEIREAWLFLPGGKTNVHVTSKNPLTCTKIAREFAMQIADVLKGIGEASIPIMSTLEGIELDSQGKSSGRRGQPLANLVSKPEKSKT